MSLSDELKKAKAKKSTDNGVPMFRPTIIEPTPPPKKLFGSLWAQGENAILFGEDGSGKTILAVQIALSIAVGVAYPWPGFENELPSQPVALFDAELSDIQFNNRYKEGLHENFYRFVFAQDQWRNLIGASVEYVVSEIERCAIKVNAKVIILDNLSALTSMADLTKTSDSIQLMGLLNEMKGKGYSILIIDHTRKPQYEREFKPISKHDLQGSKMKSNLVDSVFSLGRSCQGEDIRYLKAIKIRSFEPAFDKKNIAVMQIKANQLRLEFLETGEEWQHVNDRTGNMIKMSNEGKSQADIARNFNISPQRVSSIFKNYKKNY